MRCGISTACFFPGNTLEALRRVIDMGAPVTEIFLNTFSELEDGFVDRIAELVHTSGIQVSSLHPFSSAMEGFLFASEYAGRMRDGLALYRKYFSACRRLGIDKLVFHGDHRKNVAFPAERYAENLLEIAGAAEEFGVTLCHENVYYCRLGSPAAVLGLRPFLREKVGYVLDLKQVRRQGAALDSMLAAMQGNIRLVHISDYTPENDCVPPGLGGLDFRPLLCALQAQGYNGDLIIELYRDGFSDFAQLSDAMHYMQDLIHETRCGPQAVGASPVPQVKKQG